MEPESSLPHSQVSLTWSVTCPYPEPEQSSLCLPIPPLEDPIFIPFTFRSSKLALSLRFPLQIPLCTSPLPHVCHMPHPSHSSWFDHSKNIWRVQTYNYSLCSLLHPSPLATCHPHVFLSTLFSHTLSICSSMWETKFHTYILITGNFFSPRFGRFPCSSYRCMSAIFPKTSVVVQLFEFTTSFDGSSDPLSVLFCDLRYSVA